MELKHTLHFFNHLPYILLIVPYGIETDFWVQIGVGLEATFNRTLWN